MTAEAIGAELPAHSVDAFLGGQVTLVQPLDGHRAGLDAALLQALVPESATGSAVDLGCGAGAVAFSVAARAAGLVVRGIERDPDLVACAKTALQRRENAGFAERVRIVAGDVTAHGAQERLGRADWVLMNPPYDTPGRARPSPDARRRGAHMAEAGTLIAWCGTAAALLRPGGFVGLIHRATALPEVIDALDGRFGDIRLVPVHPAEGEPASRILIRATLASRAPLRLMPGLVLHYAGGAWAPAADAILRGRAALEL